MSRAPRIVRTESARSHLATLGLAGVLVLLLALLTACSTESPTPAESDAAGGVPVGEDVESFSLTDQNGETLSGESLRGRAWVAGFFTSTCEAPCPTVMEAQLRIQNELFNHPDSDSVRLVSLSTDPVTDTVSALATFADEQAFAYGDRWSFAAAGPDQAATLASSLGIGTGSASLALVDREGRVRGSYSAQSGVDDLLADLETVLAEPSDAKPAPTPELPHVSFPDGAENPAWIEPRQQAQLATASDLSVFHDFQFADRVKASGITFLHRVVDDAGRDYKGVHYDHGNGVAVADVDGDARLDVYFTTQLGRNELWRNLGDGTFENVTAKAGVGLGNRISVTASFADVDNDGDADLFVTTVRDGNVLFENDGTGVFTDVSAEAGVDHVGHSSGAVFFDFDKDGLLDLFVTNIGQYTHDDLKGRGGYDVGFEDAFSGHLFPERTEASILYRNLGDGRFADVSEEMGLVDGSWSGDASPLDYDEDGWTDLYVLDMQGDDELYRNLEGQGFERVSRDVFPATPWGSMGIQVFDVDRDGHQDIFLSDMHSDMSQRIGPEREKEKSDMQWTEEALGHHGNHAMGDGGPSIFGNALFLARGDGYEERSDAMGSENYWPWGLSAGDLNADGWEDVLVTSSMNFPWRYGVNTLLLNENGQRFRDAEFILGIEPRYADDGRTVVPWFTLDCSGNLDAHPLHPEICAGPEGQHSGEIMVEGALGTRSSVLFDLDGDGDLDIVTGEFHSRPQVLVSNLAEQTDVRWIEVELEGTASNRDGLGARVTVFAGGRSQVQVHDGQSGYLSQSSMPLYFGLGAADSVERIEVAWPSGRTQTVEGPIEVGRRHVLSEPSS